MTTELTLRHWRFGQTQAERLCAGALTIEGFAAVDPQHPLGGPDGLKDVLCRRGLTTFVAGVYFPTTDVSFTDIKRKFKDDLNGVAANRVGGFVFFVNQPLTVGERMILLELADGLANPTVLYHLERLRATLDAPMGCGLRLEYLGIPMTREEQVAYWSAANVDLSAKLDQIHQLQLRTLQQVRASEDGILRRTSAMLLDLRSGRSTTLDQTVPVGAAWRAGPATADIDLPILLWLHRVLLGGSGLPAGLQGVLRTLSVLVAPEDGSSPFSPPAPEFLHELVTRWCEDWRAGYSGLQAKDADARLEGIVEAYYHFLRIHPFTDGNGRMARLLLDQMLRELLDTAMPPNFGELRIEHQRALQEADSGDLAPLIDLIRYSLL